MSLYRHLQTAAGDEGPIEKRIDGEAVLTHQISAYSSGATGTAQAQLLALEGGEWEDIMDGVIDFEASAAKDGRSVVWVACVHAVRLVLTGVPAGDTVTMLSAGGG